jgi:hypothetical protein
MSQPILTRLTRDLGNEISITFIKRKENKNHKTQGPII